MGIIIAMSINFKNLALKSIPYLASIAGGVLLFTVALDNINDPVLADLISNISASLLAIPIVFLLYDYTNYRISRRLHENMAGNMDEKINVLVLHIVLVLRKALGLRGDATLLKINSMQMLREHQIAEKLRLRTEHVNLLHQYYGELENIIYRYGRENIMSDEHMHLLSEMTREISHLVNEHHLRGNRKIVAKHIKNIIDKIIDWLDSGAAIAMKFEQLLDAASKPDSPSPDKKAHF